jgi:hypothetical protein
LGSPGRIVFVVLSASNLSGPSRPRHWSVVLVEQTESLPVLGAISLIFVTVESTPWIAPLRQRRAQRKQGRIDLMGDSGLPERSKSSMSGSRCFHPLP